MTDELAKRLGALIRAAREAKGISLRALEAESGIALSWLAYLEAGRSLEPMPDRVARIAELLQLDPAKVDRVSGNYLAQSLPTVRTYFRSKGKATTAELDELERVIEEVQAKHRRPDGRASRRGGRP
jgi:transcriptional regulator with XRE-family HTH domain